MPNNIAVSITADIVDLQSKFGTARAELAATEAEFRKLARASAQGVLSDADKARYAQLSQTLLEQRSAVRALSGDLAEAGFASSTFGRAAARAGEEAAGLGINTSSAVRYTRELFDEFSSGRTRYLPSTLAELAQQGFHLSPAMLAGAGGVAALVAGLGYLVYRAVEASDALDRLHLSSLRAGNEFTRTQLDQLTQQLAQLPNMSSSAATQITTALSGIHLPFQALNAAARIAAEQMAQTGQKADQVGQEIAKALAPAVSATELAKRHQDGLTQAQVNAAEAADRSGNANEILAAKLQLLSAPLSRARADVQEYGRSWGQAFFEAGAEVGLANEGLDGQAEVLKENKGEWDANSQAIAKYTAELQGLPTEKALTFKSAKTGGGENEALAAAQEAANIKHQMAEQEIRDASQTLDRIAAAEEQARTQELAAEENAANVKHQLAERELQDAERTLKAIESARQKDAAKELAERTRDATKLEHIEDGVLSGLLSGQETFATAERRIFQQLIAAKIEMALHEATERAVIGKMAADQRGAIEGATALKSIGSDAAQAGAAAYRSVVGIPYVGPFLAPAAAAVAFAAVGAFKGLVSFDVGSFNVPQDTIANVHAGEMILNRGFAQEARDHGFTIGDGAAGGDTHVHIHATDADSVRRLFANHGTALAAEMGRQIRNGWRP